MRKAKFLRINTEYEIKQKSSTGRLKPDYVGEVCTLVRSGRKVIGHTSSRLYDFQFPDGAMFCLEADQFEWVK